MGMTAPAGGPKEAGKDVISLLTPQDLVEVSDAPFGSSAGWVVPLQHVSDKASIGGAIDRMVPGDPESYVPMLQSAYDTLRRTSAKVKHIILLGDGDAGGSRLSTTRAADSCSRHHGFHRQHQWVGTE